MKLIVGLGNPDKQYDNTRHNVGFMAVDAMAGNDVTWKSEKNALTARVEIDGKKVIYKVKGCNESAYISSIPPTMEELEKILEIFNSTEEPYSKEKTAIILPISNIISLNKIITTLKKGGLLMAISPLLPTRVSRRGLFLCSSLIVFASFAFP